LKICPERFFACFIAEQNMVGTAMGLAAQGKIPFASTFGCFLTGCDRQPAWHGYPLSLGG